MGTDPSERNRSKLGLFAKTPPPAVFLQEMRRLLAEFTPQRKVADALGCAASTVYHYAAKLNLPRRRRAHSPATHKRIRRQINQGKLSTREMAIDNAVAKSTISRIRSKQAELAMRDAPRTTRRLRSKRRCPEGHLVKEWPCLQCQALAMGKRNA